MDIVARAKNMMMSPRAAWEEVAAEPVDVARLYTGYILPLAAIPPIATLIGQQIFFPAITIGAAIKGMVAFYALSLTMVYVLGWIASKLGAMFGGREDAEAGLKLVAYSSTAVWLGGVYHLYPSFWIIGLIAAIYSVFLFFIGAPLVLGVPEGRRVGYMVAMIVPAIVTNVITVILTRGVMGFSITSGMM